MIPSGVVSLAVYECQRRGIGDCKVLRIIGMKAGRVLAFQTSAKITYAIALPQLPFLSTGEIKLETNFTIIRVWFVNCYGVLKAMKTKNDEKNTPFDSRQPSFDMLCSTGSFTVTAKRLFLTQSAVSHSMKSLEDECGSRLFRRQGKKVSLTEAGDRLLRFTRPFLVEMEKVREELDGFEKFGVGRIRLGASAQACRFLLPPMLSQFKKEHPLCRFEVKCEDTPRCLEMLGLGEIDLAITLEPIRINEIEFLFVFPMN